MLPSKVVATKKDSELPRCPLCSFPIEASQRKKLCSKCKTPHHANCLEQWTSCGIYSCQGKWIPALSSQAKAELLSNSKKWYRFKAMSLRLCKLAKLLYLFLGFTLLLFLLYLPSLSKSEIFALPKTPFYVYGSFLLATFVLHGASFLLELPAMALSKVLEGDLQERIDAKARPSDMQRILGQKAGSSSNFYGKSIEALSLALWIGVTIGLLTAFWHARLGIISVLALSTLTGLYCRNFKNEAIDEEQDLLALFELTKVRIEASCHFHSPGGNSELPAVTGEKPKLLESSSASSCPVCGCKIKEGDERFDCPRCKTPHHRDCWDYSGGCAIFGCSKRNWRGPFDPAVFNDIRSKLDDWQGHFQLQWRILLFAGFSALIAVYGELLPFEQLSTIVKYLAASFCLVAVGAYGFSLPKNLLLRHNLEKRLRISLEAPQSKARAAIARLSKAKDSSLTLLALKIVFGLSLTLTFAIPLLDAAFPSLWSESITFLEILSLCVIGVILPQCAIAAARGREEYIQSLRNRLLASFNVYRKEEEKREGKLSLENQK